MTPFEDIYNIFYSKITDDMYMELTPEDTSKLLEELLFNALPYFEFPRQNIHDIDKELKQFNVSLTHEEKNVIATYMVVEWISQQLASVENTRMKYSGSDFKFTSQANHMHKLNQLKESFKTEGFHFQRLYKRRKADENGIMKSTFGEIMNYAN